MLELASDDCVDGFDDDENIYEPVSIGSHLIWFKFTNFFHSKIFYHRNRSTYRSCRREGHCGDTFQKSTLIRWSILHVGKRNSSSTTTKTAKMIRQIRPHLLIYENVSVSIANPLKIEWKNCTIEVIAVKCMMCITPANKCHWMEMGLRMALIARAMPIIEAAVAVAAVVTHLEHQHRHADPIQRIKWMHAMAPPSTKAYRLISISETDICSAACWKSHAHRWLLMIWHEKSLSAWQPSVDEQ